MINSNLARILIALCTIGAVFASWDEKAEQVFANIGYSPLKPSKTLQLLKNLASLAEDEQTKVPIKKEEIDDLIEIAGDVTEERCNQEYVDRINKMLLKHADALLNLIPYLQYNKQKLIGECAKRYNVINLNSEVEIPGQVAEFEPDEAPEERATREAEEAKKRDELNTKLDKIIKEKKAIQDTIDAEWMKKYNAVFHDETHQMDPEEMTEALKSLYIGQTEISTTSETKSLDSDIFDLLKLTYNCVQNCNGKAFEHYDDYLKKCSDGYSNNVSNYIKHQRLKFWETCKRIFVNAQKRLQHTDEYEQGEALSLADHILNYNNLEPHLLTDIQLIDGGVLNYIRDKLGKKAHKMEKIEKLFEHTIRPTCLSVSSEFLGIEKLDEVIKNRPDLKKDLDTKAMRWLTVIRVCNLISFNTRLLKDKAFTIFQEQRREEKSKTCIGKWFSKGGS